MSVRRQHDLQHLLAISNMCWTRDGGQEVSRSTAPQTVPGADGTFFQALPIRTFHDMPDYRDLTDLQLALLGVLWERGEATIADIYESLGEHTGVTRKTVGTLMSRLEKRGVVKRRARGNEGVYTAAVPRRAVLVSRMVSVLGAVFEAPSKKPVPHLLERGQVRPDDVARLRALLRKAERDLKGDS